LKSVRLGCVKYLNARPLIRGWSGNVEFDHPSALCRRLAEGQLDVALVSSFEFLRNPIYRIVDDVSIASDGPVYSVIVAHRGEFSTIEEIELDPASQTAANLLRCLLAEARFKPRLVRHTDLQSVCPAPKAFGTASTTTENISAGRTGDVGIFRPKRCARLIIGDQAIRFRQSHADAYQFWDLGEQWKKLTALPFVYALWLIRPEVPDAEAIAERLRAIRNENLGDLPGIVSGAIEDLPEGEQATTQQFLDRYYNEHLRFDFGPRTKQGLQTFADLCWKNGVLPKRAIEFSLV
jgi:chorismate dehydratase